MNNVKSISRACCFQLCVLTQCVGQRL